MFLFAAVLLGRDPSSLSLYDASLSEWAAADDLPMALDMTAASSLGGGAGPTPHAQVTVVRHVVPLATPRCRCDR